MKKKNNSQLLHLDHLILERSQLGSCSEEDVSGFFSGDRFVPWYNCELTHLWIWRPWLMKGVGETCRPDKNFQKWEREGFTDGSKMIQRLGYDDDMFLVDSQCKLYRFVKLFARYNRFPTRNHKCICNVHLHCHQRLLVPSRAQLLVCSNNSLIVRVRSCSLAARCFRFRVYRSHLPPRISCERMISRGATVIFDHLTPPTSAWLKDTRITKWITADTVALMQRNVHNCRYTRVGQTVVQIQVGSGAQPCSALLNDLLIGTVVDLLS